jgi:uncharacterized iron-regulated protein
MQVLFALLLSLISLQAKAQLLDGQNLSEVSIEQIKSHVTAGSVLVIGEIHDSVAHHQNQVEVLKSLNDLRVSVGFEFFEWPNQTQVDQFTAGKISENDFLQQIGWGKIPFDLYREQALYGPAHNGYTVALNAPRTLTARISKVGLAGLTDEEKKLLPPDFKLGNANYYERFREVMGQHVPESAIERYFAAQSTWDDTMAHVATSFLAKFPEQALVIIVGDFHAAYDGGLPNRLRARGVKSVTVISQVVTEGLSQGEINLLVSPHPKYGPRGDYVWLVP